MSLASRGAPPDVRKGPLCDTCRTIQALSEDDRATLAEWFERPNVDTVNEWISAQLEADGHKAGPSSLERHRRGGCRRVAG